MRPLNLTFVLAVPLRVSHSASASTCWPASSTAPVPQRHCGVPRPGAEGDGGEGDGGRGGGEDQLRQHHAGHQDQAGATLSTLVLHVSVQPLLGSEV